MATYGTLRSYARRQARDAVGAKADAMIDAAIAEALAMIARERPWTWYMTHGQIRLFGAANRTASVTNGATTVFLGTAPPSFVSSASIQLIKMAYGGRWYRFSSISGTQLTLTDPWPEASISAATVTLYQDEYLLPSDCVRLARIFPGSEWVWGGEPVGFEDVLAAYNLAQVGQRIPGMWAIYRNRLVVWPYPSANTAVNILYYRMPATMTSNSDVADWDPLHDELLLRAVDYQLAIAFGTIVPGDAAACRNLYVDALQRATKAERTPQWHGSYTMTAMPTAPPDIVYAS